MCVRVLENCICEGKYIRVIYSSDDGSMAYSRSEGLRSREAKRVALRLKAGKRL